MSSRLLHILATGLCLLSCALPTDSEAFFASVKAWGMGGCGVALPQDTLCVAYNPAGMVYMGNKGDIGVDWRQTNPKTVVTDSLTPGANGTFHGTRGKEFGTPELGINYMVFDSVDVSVGCVAYTRDFIKSSYPNTFPDFGTSRLLFEYYAGCISPVAAIRFERLAIGVSCDFIIQRLKVMGLQNFDNAFDTVFQGDVTNKKESVATTVAVTIGGSYRVTDCFTIGVAWQLRGYTWDPFKDYRGLVANRGFLDTPTRIIGGFYWNPFPCYGIAVDVEYFGWNKINWWRHKFPSTQSDLTSLLFGSSKGPGFGWDDQTIVHVGGDMHVGCGIVLRAGYRYASNPIPKAHTFFNTLTTNVVDQIITVGLTMPLGCGQEMSLYYAYGIGRTMHGKPIGSDFGNGVYSISNQTQGAGLSIGYCW